MSALDPARLSIRVLEAPGGRRDLPAELVALREAVYAKETGFLDEREVVRGNDMHGLHVCAYYDPGDGSGPRLVGATHAVEAELCDFASTSGLEPEALARGVYMTRTLIALEYRHAGLYPFLLYLSLLDFRARGCDILYAWMLPGDTPLRAHMRYDFLDDVPPRRVLGRGGATYELHAAWERMDYGLHRAWKSMPPHLQEWVRDGGHLADQVERAVATRLDAFYKGPWLATLRSGGLTKAHYVATLSNMHQFVRWTTRILAKVVGMTPDAALRRHYIQHLKGEVDHKRMIENDLAQLGADLEYVMHDMVPHPAVRKFMALQESLCSFRQDPVLFLGVPIAVEGISAQLPSDFGPALFAAARGWGVADPRKVTTFLGSHVHTDGGDDGHWEKTREMITRLVVSERQLQELLGVIHAVMDAQEEMYASYVDLPDFRSTLARRGVAGAA